MRWSDERILTTHTGSLPRPPELTRLYVRRARGGEVDPAERRLAEPVEFGRVDRLAAGAPDIEPGQLGRARQTAGMGRQDPLGAPMHGLLPISAAIARPGFRGRETPRRG